MYLTHSSEYSVNILLNFYKIQDSTSSKHVKIEILDFCPKPPTSLNRPIFPSIYKRGFGLTWFRCSVVGCSVVGFSVVGRSVEDLICYDKILKGSFTVDLALCCVAQICFEPKKNIFVNTYIFIDIKTINPFKRLFSISRCISISIQI